MRRIAVVAVLSIVWLGSGYALFSWKTVPRQPHETMAVDQTARANVYRPSLPIAPDDEIAKMLSTLPRSSPTPPIKTQIRQSQTAVLKPSRPIPLINSAGIPHRSLQSNVTVQ